MTAPLTMVLLPPGVADDDRGDIVALFGIGVAQDRGLADVERQTRPGGLGNHGGNGGGTVAPVDRRGVVGGRAEWIGIQ